MIEPKFTPVPTQACLYSQEAAIRAEAVEKIRRDEAESHKKRMRKQAELRREFMVLNARLRDLKKLEEEMNNIEKLQVYNVIYILNGSAGREWPLLVHDPSVYTHRLYFTVRLHTFM